MNKQADREKTCGTCRNEDTYNCAECENKSDYEQAQAEVNAHVIQSALDNGTNTVIGTAQADGEYILKKDVMGCIGQTSLHSELARKLRGLPSVAIPNKVGHWEYNQYDGNLNIGNWHCSECRNIVSDMPTCMGKPLYEFCPHCGSPMEIER